MIYFPFFNSKFHWYQYEVAHFKITPSDKKYSNVKNSNWYKIKIQFDIIVLFGF